MKTTRSGLKAGYSRNTVQLVVFILIIALIGGVAIYKSFASGCTISSPVGSTSDRKITLNMTGCTGTQYFRVSESPDFGASQGVQLKINSVAADKSYADVSITYPGGTPATGSTPFTLPSPAHSVKALAVLFTFDDNNGSSAGLGDYETTSWVQKLIFGGGSFDGTFTNNSVKDYIFQSSDGQESLTGNVYPQIIHLPLEKYRQVLGSGGNVQAHFGEDVLQAIQASNPTYLSSGGYDFLVGLSSEQYSVSRNLFPTGSTSVRAGDYGNIKNYITYSIPVDLSKSIFANTIQENRTSTDASTVITRYNPESGSVEGVWLASDTNRTGTNYFSGGSITQTPDTQFGYLKLGTALPSPNTPVVVRYKADYANSVHTSSVDTVSTSGWFSHFSHELEHQISVVPAYHFGQRDTIGDMYYPPDDGETYDLMANGNMTSVFDSVLQKYYDTPALFSAYHRSILGYATPYTLQYGQNESSVRLFRAENGDPANDGRTTMIKIPLQPPGDEGLETRLVAGATGVGPTTASQQYRGNEYLLLEWRYKGDGLENGMYNFDRAEPSEGLGVYHVIESAPYGITAASTDIVRIQDATPSNASFSEGFSDTSSSPALFGPQSGVMSYTTSAYWQEKTINNDSHSFEYLLSPGHGTKTLYFQFADSNGNVSTTQQLSVDLTSDQQPSQRMPTLSINLPNGATISNSTNVVANYTAPNGAKNIRFYVDGVSKLEAKEGTMSQTSTTFSISPGDYAPGAHQLVVIFYDGGMNKVTASANFQIVGNGDIQPPFASISQPTNGSTVWGAIRVNAAGTDNVGVTKSELYVDGSILESTKSSIIDYNWYTTQVPNGVHTLMDKVYDAAGNTSSSQVSITVQNSTSSTDSTAPAISITNPVNGATVSGTVSIAANASDNVGVSQVVFQVDGATKATVTASPYNYNWDSTAASNGSHTLTAIAYDAAGNSSTSSVAVTVSNGDVTAPSTPTNLSASATAYNRVNLSWTASTDNVGVSGYYVVRNGVTIAQVSGTGTTFTDTTVNASTNYSYQVMSYDAAGNTSALSAPANVTTPAAPDTTPPSQPTGLTASAVSSSQINLAWTASSDNVGVASYDIFRNGSRIANISTTSYGDTGLAASTNYTYYVVAKDAAGNSSAASATATATTQAPVTTGSISGTISSSGGSALAGVSITIKYSGTNHTYSSDASGNYTITNVPPGSYSVKYSKSGYNTQTVTVSVTLGQNTIQNISLVSTKKR